jgi:hypothetical protein
MLFGTKTERSRIATIVVHLWFFYTLTGNPVNDSFGLIFKVQLFEVTEHKPASFIARPDRLSLVRCIRRAPDFGRGILRDIPNYLHNRA